MYFQNTPIPTVAKGTIDTNEQQQQQQQQQQHIHPPFIPGLPPFMHHPMGPMPDTMHTGVFGVAPPLPPFGMPPSHHPNSFMHHPMSIPPMIPNDPNTPINMFNMPPPFAMTPMTHLHMSMLHQQDLHQQQQQQQQVQLTTPPHSQQQQQQQQQETPITPRGEENPNRPSLSAIFEDLASRFVINIPAEELESFERMLFQIESAYWFYDDFYREDYTHLPKYSLGEFTKVFFAKCPLLSPHKNQVEEILKRFSEYKTRVPVYGAIILNTTMEKALFVKGYNSSSWGFPKGKVNKDEPDTDCAVREVLEEVGFDIGPYLNPRHYIEIEFMKQQKIKLFIIQGISEETVFCPRTRKEISKIEWMVIDDLPTFSKKPVGPSKEKNFFRSIPFFIKLKKWIANRKAKRNNINSSNNNINNSSTTKSTPNNNQQQQLDMTPKVIMQRNKDTDNNTSNSSSVKKKQFQLPTPSQIQQQQQQQLTPAHATQIKNDAYSPYPESPPASPRKQSGSNYNQSNNLESSFYTNISTPQQQQQQQQQQNQKNKRNQQQQQKDSFFDIPSSNKLPQQLSSQHPPYQSSLETQFDQLTLLKPNQIDTTTSNKNNNQRNNQRKSKYKVTQAKSFYDSPESVSQYPSTLPPNHKSIFSDVQFNHDDLKSNFKSK